eukprot:1158672-Pelagomonas_calceolata.AAC.22
MDVSIIHALSGKGCRNGCSGYAHPKPISAQASIACRGDSHPFKLAQIRTPLICDIVAAVQANRRQTQSSAMLHRLQ